MITGLMQRPSAYLAQGRPWPQRTFRQASRAGMTGPKSSVGSVCLGANDALVMPKGEEWNSKAPVRIALIG